jgi:hypothetical protein
MSHVRFEPSKTVTFDLSHGLVHVEGAHACLLVPADALAALSRSAGAEATQSFGRALGEAIGQRAAQRLAAGDGVRGASAEAVLEHLGGELSLSGFGSLSLERWGRALVLVVDHSPLGAAGDTMLEAVLAAAVEAAMRQRVSALLLGRDAVRARFLLTGSAGVEKVRAWLADGISWGDALVRLHAGAGTSSAGSQVTQSARPSSSGPADRESASNQEESAPSAPEATSSGGAPAPFGAAPVELTPELRGDA